ncbi:MAG: hypothetical protein K0R20_2739 [Actinomycetia bacterium]|jgi:hypothetical protein|nr:hypothetical protein [Actinomycetes bacterium]
MVLERIRFGTYQQEEIDIDAMNQAFYDAMHDVPFAVVRAQGVAARNRMLPSLAIAPGKLAGGGQMDPQGRTGSLRGAPAAAPGVGERARAVSASFAIPSLAAVKRAEVRRA